MGGRAMVAEELERRAALRSGLITRGEALAAGMTRSGIGRRLASGRWVALYQRIYRVGRSTRVMGAARPGSLPLGERGGVASNGGPPLGPRRSPREPGRARREGAWRSERPRRHASQRPALLGRPGNAQRNPGHQRAAHPDRPRVRTRRRTPRARPERGVALEQALDELAEEANRGGRTVAAGRRAAVGDGAGPRPEGPARGAEPPRGEVEAVPASPRVSEPDAADADRGGRPSLRESSTSRTPGRSW